MKADDDTYFLLTNLLTYLSKLDPALPYFLGRKFHLGNPGGLQYVSGGGGYVLSRAALARMVGTERWYERCVGQNYVRIQEGDTAIGSCLQMAGTKLNINNISTGGVLDNFPPFHAIHSS